MFTPQPKQHTPQQGQHAAGGVLLCWTARPGDFCNLYRVVVAVPVHVCCLAVGALADYMCSSCCRHKCALCCVRPCHVSGSQQLDSCCQTANTQCIRAYCQQAATRVPLVHVECVTCFEDLYTYQSRQVAGWTGPAAEAGRFVLVLNISFPLWWASQTYASLVVLSISPGIGPYSNSAAPA